MGAGVGALLFTVYLFIVFWFMDQVLPIQKNKIKKKHIVYIFKVQKNRHQTIKYFSLWTSIQQIHSMKKYLLSIYVPGTVLALGIHQ